jgi:hypothetical protein
VRGKAPIPAGGKTAGAIEMVPAEGLEPPTP